MASRVSNALLTADILNTVMCGVGVVVAILGREKPTLVGGNLMVALMLGTLVRSAQERDAGGDQWPWWPITATLASFAGISLVLWCLRDTVLAALTGLALSVSGVGLVLALGVYRPIELGDAWSLPIGVPVGAALYAVGFVFGLVAAKRPRKRERLALLLSAVTGAFLALSGTTWFRSGHSLATDFAQCLVDSGRSREDARLAAEEVRVPAIAWAALTLGFLGCRAALLTCYDMLRSGGDDKDAKVVPTAG